MPSTITLSRLCWATPEGRPLLADIDLTFGAERTGLVGRNGVGKSTLLHLVAGTLHPQSGTISREATLGVLRQSVQVEAGATVADLFGARAGLDLLERAGRGAATADELAEADWTLDTRIEAALARLGFAVEPATPLAALSGGQRTRAALAALVFAAPDFLILDEPTNNLDRDGRAAVRDLLAGWKAGAIVVSHDRELLDGMDAIVELSSLGAIRYGGNWTVYRERRTLDLAAARHDLADAARRVADIERRAQATAEGKARSDAAGQHKRARGDMPRILMNGLKNRAEATGGDNARLAEARLAEAIGAAAAARARIEVLQPLKVSAAPSGLPAGRTVLALDRVSAGYLPGRPVVRDVSLTITGPERVALTGPNGSGKTTLLGLVSGALAPCSGVVQVSPRLALLDQKVSLLDPAASILDNFRRLNPEADDNACRAALARFMFRAEAALQIVGTLSGGQMLRAGLACVLGGDAAPDLLVLDEPTNHLDIEAVEAVEAGLRAYDGALLVVSHDEPFLAAIGITRRVGLGGER